MQYKKNICGRFVCLSNFCQERDDVLSEAPLFIIACMLKYSISTYTEHSLYFHSQIFNDSYLLNQKFIIKTFYIFELVVWRPWEQDQFWIHLNYIFCIYFNYLRNQFHKTSKGFTISYKCYIWFQRNSQTGIRNLQTNFTHLISLVLNNSLQFFK